MRNQKFSKDDPVVMRPLHVALVSATSLTDRLFYSRRIGYNFEVESVDLYAYSKAGTVTLNGCVIAQGTGIYVAPAITVHSTPEQLASAAFKYMIAAQAVEKAAATGLTFTAAHVISAACYGIILVQINASGTISTKVPAATQAYTDANQARANKPAPDSGNIEIANILILAGVAAWTANTDDMTASSDLSTITITNAAAATKFLSAGTFTGLKGVTPTVTKLAGNSGDYICLFYTTDGSGAVVNATVETKVRPRPLRGEA